MLAARVSPAFLPICDAAELNPRASGVSSRPATSPLPVLAMSVASRLGRGALRAAGYFDRLWLYILGRTDLSMQANYRPF